MPVYLYQHPETEQVKEIIQSVNDIHEYFEDGIKWNRIFTVPQVGVDTQINPNDSRAFVEKTGKMKGTLGSIMDFSKELSERRGGDNDPLRKQYYDNYSKTRKGRDHPDVAKKKLEKKMAKKGVSLG